MNIFQLRCVDNLNTVLEYWDLQSLPFFYPILAFGIWKPWRQVEFISRAVSSITADDLRFQHNQWLLSYKIGKMSPQLWYLGVARSLTVVVLQISSRFIQVLVVFCFLQELLFPTAK